MSNKSVLFFITIFLFTATNSFALTKYFTQKSLGELVAGKENQEVKNLQQALYDFGYYKSEEDEPEFSGKFENDLFIAIKDFQETNDLRVTGRADFATLKTMNEFIKFQNDSLEEEESKSISTKDEGPSGYVVDEKNYFKDDEEVGYFADKSSDVVGAYADTQKTKTAEISTAGKTSAMGKIVNSILNFFIPSEKYRNDSKLELDAQNAEVYVNERVQKKTNKFENYGYFDCIDDDECIKYMREKESTDNN